ncbi:hypothetical protein JTB14_028557 [Gonioctena quinquepunctata]|nr:hypothetical protein JTB14_028557 [Gonioctena quinquepunctata]
MWVIANFTLENAVEVVPQQWISGNQCYWLPYRGLKLKSAIADRYKVGDDWDLHPIRISNKNKTYVYDCVKRIHSRILPDEIAFEYNWHGLKGKKSFRDSFLAKAIIEAIMRNKHVVTSEKNIEEAIKSWLRHAKDRLLRRGPADKENIVPD